MNHKFIPPPLRTSRKRERPDGVSPDGLREFKEGAAYLAIEAGVPAVPIGITGTRQVLPMGSLHVRPHAVTVRIGDPISAASMLLSRRCTVCTVHRATASKSRKLPSIFPQKIP